MNNICLLVSCVRHSILYVLYLPCSHHHKKLFKLNSSTLIYINLEQKQQQHNIMQRNRKQYNTMLYIQLIQCHWFHTEDYITIHYNKISSAKEWLWTSFHWCKNKFNSSEDWFNNSFFYYKEAWRMLIVPDWKLEGFGHVEHQRWCWYLLLGLSWKFDKDRIWFGLERKSWGLQGHWGLLTGSLMG